MKHPLLEAAKQFENYLELDSETKYSSEHRLLMAVLCRAVRDLEGELMHIRRDARDFFLNPRRATTPPFGFVCICEELGLCPNSSLRQLRERGLLVG